jgi:hypothetical protein
LGIKKSRLDSSKEDEDKGLKQLLSTLRNRPVIWKGEFEDKTEEELLIINKMIEYKEKTGRGQPYSQLNLVNILCPEDQLESIILYSSKRHGK